MSERPAVQRRTPTLVRRFALALWLGLGPLVAAQGAQANDPVVPVQTEAAAMPASSALAAPAACPPPINTALAAVPLDRGYLWRITRAGRQSFLFGTVHVGKPTWREWGPQTELALRASDTLALELDPSDPSLQTAILETPTPPPLGAERAARLQRAIQAACISALAMVGLHPVLQVSTLSVLESRWHGLAGDFASETLLVERARRLRQRVVALETAQLQKDALIPTDPAQVLALVDDGLLQVENQTTRRVLGRLVAAWETGDLAALESYPQWCECADSPADRAHLQRLNDARNPALARRIERLHQQGRRVFAAVGALHMTGPKALPHLLAARGFKVERVQFTIVAPTTAPP
jgi:uncharacterized protein